MDWDELRKVAIIRESGAPAEALKRYEFLRETCLQKEERSVILLNESLCYCDLGRFEEAERAAISAINLSPDGTATKAYAKSSLACVYERKGELELAAKELRSLLQTAKALSPTTAYPSFERDVQHRLAAVLIALGQALEPLSLIQGLKETSRTPEELSELLYREGTALAILNRHDRALQAFRQAVAGPLDPQLRARAHFRSGEILFDRAEFPKALVEFEEAMRRTASDSPDNEVIAGWISATKRAIA